VGRKSLNRKVGHPTRTEDNATLARITQAAELFLEGVAQWEIAEALGVSERTVRNYLTDANRIFKERAEAVVSMALATALEKRRIFARNLAEVRNTLSRRNKKGHLVVSETVAKEIVNVIRAEMTNQDRVEKLTGAEPQTGSSGGPPGVTGRSVRIRGAHGILYEYYIGADGKVTGEKIIEVSGKVVVEEGDDGQEVSSVEPSPE